MEKLFISLLLALFLQSKLCLCQSVNDVCRFRISGTFPHPDPQRCDLYVQCRLFQANVRECPTGTIFTSSGNQCVPGERETCTVAAPSTTPTPSPTTTVNLNVCEGINLGSIGIPGDCTQFILCILGQGSLIVCGENEVFDQTVGSCVPGNPVTCQVFTTTTRPTTAAPTTTTTTTIPITTMTSTSSSPPTTASSSTTSSSATQPTLLPPIGNVCTGNNFRYVANPRACYRYFYCLFGTPIPGECALTRIFVEAQQSCVPGNRNTCTPSNI